MAYDVDFWYQSQDACQITSDFTPFSDDQESIYEIRWFLHYDWWI